MPNHTPGPWWRDDDGFVAAGSGDDYVTVADPHASDLDIDEREANADLIAAAPDLYDALREVNAAHISGNQTRQHAAIGLVRVALAKAEGR